MGAKSTRRRRPGVVTKEAGGERTDVLTLARRLAAFHTAEEWAEELQWQFYNQPLAELPKVLEKLGVPPIQAQEILDTVVRRDFALATESTRRPSQPPGMEDDIDLTEWLNRDADSAVDWLASRTRAGNPEWGSREAREVWRDVMAWLSDNNRRALVNKVASELYEIGATREQKARRDALLSIVYGVTRSLTFGGDFPGWLARAVGDAIHRRYVRSMLG